MKLSLMILILSAISLRRKIGPSRIRRSARKISTNLISMVLSMPKTFTVAEIFHHLVETAFHLWTLCDTLGVVTMPSILAFLEKFLPPRSTLNSSLSNSVSVSTKAIDENQRRPSSCVET